LPKAVEAARQGGYRIVVRDRVLEWSGPLVIGRGTGAMAVPKDLKIETEEGAKVVWRLKDAKPSTALLVLSNVEGGFTLRGFTFEGYGQVDNAILVTGSCPGLTLRDLKLQGFKRNAIAISNCQGSKDQPVLIKDLWIQATKPESAFSFAISKNIPTITRNQHIKISAVQSDSGTTFTKGLVQPIEPDLDKVIDKQTVILP